MRSRHVHLLLFALFASSQAEAQWGVRWTIFHHEQQTGRSGLNMLFGLDHDPSDRTSIGLDFITQFNLFNEGGLDNDIQYAGYQVYYTLSRKVIGLQYRSIFFLSSAGGSGAYIGPYLGFRKFTRSVDAAPYTQVPSGIIEPAWPNNSTASTWLYPVGMRLGLRSELDGVFMDLHFSMGYQIGHAKETLQAPYLAEEDKLKGFPIQAAYVVGIGW